MSSFPWLDDLKISDSEAYESIKRYLSTPAVDLPAHSTGASSAAPVLPPLPPHTADWPQPQGHKEMASKAMSAPAHSRMSSSSLDQRDMSLQYLPPGQSPPLPGGKDLNCSSRSEQCAEYTGRVSDYDILGSFFAYQSTASCTGVAYFEYTRDAHATARRVETDTA